MTGEKIGALGAHQEAADRAGRTATVVRGFQLFLGAIFASAGLYRLVYWDAAISEMQALSMPLPYFSAALLIALELVCAVALVTNRGAAWALRAVAALLALSGAIGVYNSVISGGANLHELFVFDPNPTDIMLHVTYLIIVVGVMYLRAKGSAGWQKFYSWPGR